MSETTQTSSARADDAAFAARWMPIGVGVAFIGASALAGARFGLPVTILALAAGALVLVITLAYRTLAITLDDDRPDAESLDDVDVPTAAEERKERALKALADLEHEHAIGKLNEEDFDNLRARFRQEAKLAMRAVDDEHKERRAAAEAYLAKLQRSPAAKAIATRPAASTATAGATETTKRPECPGCHKGNDDDARFCKHCGRTLTEESG